MSTIDHVEAEEIEFPPDYRNYLVYCDESSIDRQSFYGWGSLWIPAEARGRLAGLLGSLKRKHHFEGEVKWNKVKSRSEAFFHDLTTQFFQRNWMMFHALLVMNKRIRKEWYKGGIPEARLHHLELLLRKKILFFSEYHPDKVYHVRVDPLPSAYLKEDQKLHKITNARLRQEIGIPNISTLLTRESHLSAGIQMADFFVGALLCPWNGNVSPDSVKSRMAQYVLSHLGWDDHRHDTLPEEWKFNIWHLVGKGEDRYVTYRPIRPRYPIAPYRRR